MAKTFTIEVFSRAQHDRSQFDCGVASLNNYLKRQISGDIRRNLARCYVAVNAERTGDKRRVEGYFTLSAHAVRTAELSSEQLKSCPYPSVPAVLIGRLAVCLSTKGERLGTQLVIGALLKAIELHKQLGTQLVVVDPLGENVVGFYEKFGFEEFGDNRLMLPIKTAIKALAVV